MSPITNIIKFTPNRVWRSYLGGKNLDQIQKVPNPVDTNFPEDWIGSTIPAVNPNQTNKNEGLSRIIFNNQEIYLKELYQLYGETLLGKEHFRKYGATSQFLLKYLDSSIRLHLQCHPTVEFSKKYLDMNNGKTEAYVILKIRDEIKDPFIYLGFQREPSRNDFRNAVLHQDIEKLLAHFDKIPVKEGDVFLVPGGIPHAIGAGIFMVEIMEPTDLTVRFEFEREGMTLPQSARFMNRDIDFAMDMVQFKSYSLDELHKQYFIRGYHRVQMSASSYQEVLIDSKYTDCFRVKKMVIRDQVNIREDSFYYAVVIKGQGKLSAGPASFNAATFDRFFISHSTDNLLVSPNTDMEIVTVFPPK